MDISLSAPLSGFRLQRARAFLEGLDLRWDDNIESTVCLLDDGEVIATGSRHQNVLKCIGVSPSREGEGLTATVVTELVKDALASGFQHLFLFTKPGNVEKFGGLGFYLVAQTNDVALLENRRGGIRRFVESFGVADAEGTIGAVVANCNPFTNGHRYLIETAASRCDRLHLFILSEDRSAFPADVRMELARQGTADLSNVVVHPTSDYLISSATFPDYFIKDKVQAKAINCELDLTIFAECFAAPLGITRRFVGHEPFDQVTASYNRQMHDVLPRHGVEVVEIPRTEQAGSAISASRVRALLAEGKLEELRPMVPPTTYAHLETLVHAGEI